MSQVKIQGNPSGTGTFTIAAPNSNSDQTLNLPNGSGTINTSGAPNEVPAGSVSAPAIYPTGDTNTGIFFPAADTIAFAEGGVEAGRFDSGGRFGVGITPSAWSASYTVQQTGFVNTYSLSDYQGGFVRGAFFNGSNWIAQNSFMGMVRYVMDEDNHIWQRASGTSTGGTITWLNTAQINSSGQRSTVIPSGSTLYPAYDCRAWVNFNGTGTVAIRGSGNVTSITDNGTGDYTVNFTTAMPDVNYSVVGMCSRSALTSPASVGILGEPATLMSTSQVRIQVNNTAGGLDLSQVNVAIFR